MPEIILEDPDSILPSLQVPLPGDKANAMTSSTGAGIKELLGAPVAAWLSSHRTNLANLNQGHAIQAATLVGHAQRLDAVEPAVDALETASAEHGSRIYEAEQQLDRVDATLPCGRGGTKRITTNWPIMVVDSQVTRSLQDGVITVDYDSGPPSLVAMLPLDLVPLTLIKGFGFLCRGAGFSELPGTLPSVELVKLSPSGMTTEVAATASDISANLTAFQGWHGGEANDLTEGVSAAYQYFLRLRVVNQGPTGATLEFGPVWYEVV